MAMGLTARRVLLGVVPSLALLGRQASADIQMVEYSGTQAQRSAISYFSARLREPDSAKWQFFPAPAYGTASYGAGYDAGTGWFLCGTVNGKNGYGGFTGPTFFLVRFADQTFGKGVDGAIAGPTERQFLLNACGALYAR